MADNEWVRLTPEGWEGGCLDDVRWVRVDPILAAAWEIRVGAEPDDERNWAWLYTAELAAIPPVKALVEALRAVEWSQSYCGSFCPWCQRPREKGHAPHCARQLALAALGADAPATVDPGAQVEEE